MRPGTSRVRSFPDRPIVGVGAVIVDGDRVLLVKRAHEPLKGEWSLPGGGVEIGETLAEAVRREVQEETGLEVRVGEVVDVVDRVHHTADGRVEYHFVIVDYLCRVAGGALRHGSDASDVCWAPVAALPSYGLTETAAAVIAKAFAMTAGGEAREPRP